MWHLGLLSREGTAIGAVAFPLPFRCFGILSNFPQNCGAAAQGDTAILRCFKGCNAPLFACRVPSCCTHQSLEDTVELEFLRNLTLGGILSLSSNRHENRIFVMCSFRSVEFYFLRRREPSGCRDRPSGLVLHGPISSH